MTVPHLDELIDFFEVEEELPTATTIKIFQCGVNDHVHVVLFVEGRPFAQFAMGQPMLDYVVECAECVLARRRACN